MPILQVNGTEYDLSSKAIRKSRVLSAIFSGRFRETDTATLRNIKPSLLGELDQLIGYLETDRIGPITSPQQLIGLLTLADYLDVPSFSENLDLVTIAPILDRLEDDELEEFVDTYAELDEILLSYAMDRYDSLDDIPPRLREMLHERITYDISTYTGGPMTLLLIPAVTELPKPISKNIPPHDQINIMNLSWARVCQSSYRPTIIEDDNVPRIISSGRTIVTQRDLRNNSGNEYYLACTGDKAPYIKTKAFSYCCSASPRDTIDPGYPDYLGEMVVARSSTGYLVFVPLGYNADYIVLDDPIIDHKLKWIYPSSADIPV